jgi:LPS-assembly protein
MCALVSPALAFAEEAPAEGGLVQINGDKVEYFHEEGKAVGTGNVKIDYEGTQLTADKITVFTETKKALAEGHVTLTQEGSVYTGDSAEYDFQTKKGNVQKLTAEIEKTYYGKARQVERLGEGHFRMSDGSFTTCCCAEEEPFYKIQAQTVDYYPGDKVAMRNAVMYIKGVPMLFIPYFEQKFLDFDRFPVQLVPGNRSEWGPFLLSKWRWNMVDRPGLKVKGNVLADWRHKKGFGGGAEAFYQGDALGRGVVRGYYANDNNEPEEVNNDRSRHQWRHQSKLTPDTTLTAEFNKLSDPLVVKDFFYHEEYERDTAPDNYVSIIKATPDYTLSFLERPRVNDFFPSVERNPEVRFDTHNRQIAETSFYFRHESQASNLKKTPAEADFSADLARYDANNTLTYAGKIGAVSVAPHVGTRQGYYSRRALDDDDLVRGVFDGGVDLSVHFYKTYDWYNHNLGLDINQVRHIFTPTASYNFRPNPTASRTILEQFDALDAIDKDHFIRLNFEHKFLTKGRQLIGGKEELVSREFARIIPFLDYDVRTGRMENVGIDAELRPYSWLGIEADAGYNPITRDWETANVDVFWEKGRWKVGLGQRYVQDESSLTTAEVKLKLNDEWSFRAYERFEFEEGDHEEFEFTVSKAFQCVIADFSYNLREDEEHTFFVTLRLKAFPSVPFRLSQSYSQPKASRQG